METEFPRGLEVRYCSAKIVRACVRVCISIRSSEQTRKQVKNHWSARRMVGKDMPLFTPESSPGLRCEG